MPRRKRLPAGPRPGGPLRAGRDADAPPFAEPHDDALVAGDGWRGRDRSGQTPARKRAVGGNGRGREKGAGVHGQRGIRRGRDVPRRPEEDVERRARRAADVPGLAAARVRQGNFRGDNAGRRARKEEDPVVGVHGRPGCPSGGGPMLRRVLQTTPV